jgi:transcription initiation factor TFIIE subunit alpha
LYRFVSDETLMHIARTVGGDEGGEILKVLRDVKEITIYELTDKTGIQINTVRKLLHKFYKHSIVTYRRFRDEDTGWFIFQWKLQLELFEAFIQGLKQKILKKLQTRLEYELRHVFYRCGSSTCPKITFEDAIETVFHCPVCNDSLRPVDNSATIHFLKRKIAKIEEELSK